MKVSWFFPNLALFNLCAWSHTLFLPSWWISYTKANRSKNVFLEVVHAPAWSNRCWPSWRPAAERGLRHFLRNLSFFPCSDLTSIVHSVGLVYASFTASFSGRQEGESCLALTIGWAQSSFGQWSVLPVTPQNNITFGLQALPIKFLGHYEGLCVTSSDCCLCCLATKWR